MLNLDFMNLTDEFVSFPLHKPTKTSKPGKHTPDLMFKAYPHDRDFCVVKCIRMYIVKSDITRKLGVRDLFITHGKPHNAAACSTIAT